MSFYEFEQCIQDFERCSEGGIVSSNVQDDVIGLFFKDWNNVVMVICYVAPGKSCTLTSLFLLNLFLSVAVMVGLSPQE